MSKPVNLDQLAFKIIQTQFSTVKYIPKGFVKSGISSYCYQYAINLDDNDIEELTKKIEKALKILFSDEFEDFIDTEEEINVI